MDRARCRTAPKLPVNCQLPAGRSESITLKNRTPSPVVQRFIDCAREVAKPLGQ